MESIFGALRDMALIQKTGGGSKREQVLRSGKLEETALLGVQACPECGGTMIETSGCISCSSCGYAFCAM